MVNVVLAVAKKDWAALNTSHVPNTVVFCVQLSESGVQLSDSAVQLFVASNMREELK